MLPLFPILWMPPSFSRPEIHGIDMEVSYARPSEAFCAPPRAADPEAGQGEAGQITITTRPPEVRPRRAPPTEAPVRRPAQARPAAWRAPGTIGPWQPPWAFPDHPRRRGS